MNYQVFAPGRIELPICEISDSGETDSPVINYFVDQLRRGIGKESVNRIRCVPVTEKRIKERDIKSLAQLVTGRKWSGSRKGNNRNLKPITKEARYTGKIDWKAAHPKIERMIREDVSLSGIAKALGVSKSTLSEANKRYKLYPRRVGHAETRRRAAERREKQRRSAA